MENCDIFAATDWRSRVSFRLRTRPSPPFPSPATPLLSPNQTAFLEIHFRHHPLPPQIDGQGTGKLRGAGFVFVMERVHGGLDHAMPCWHVRRMNTQQQTQKFGYVATTAVAK